MKKKEKQLLLNKLDALNKTHDGLVLATMGLEDYAELKDNSYEEELYAIKKAISQLETQINNIIVELETLLPKKRKGLK
jgi:rhamnose utilization protein RhaD (predicted bifunctional aldolase and dehydrogenase)